MPHGYSERIAEEVLRTFESPCASTPSDRIARAQQTATASVPFYRRIGPIPFTDLPVVDKSMMVRCQQDFLSEDFREGQLATRFSSGSSGIPFKTLLDPGRVARHRAELVAAYRFLGADPFGPLLHCRPWFSLGRAGRLSHVLRGQRLHSGEDDAASIRAVARWIERHPGATVVGLSSFLERLLRRFEDLGISFSPGAVAVVLAVGEPASRYLTCASERVLGTLLSRRYSNMENGLLGFARAGEKHFRLDTSTFLVEVMEIDRDVPAAPGATGRLVVTDLFNRAQPFLHYDTGDLGRLAVDVRGQVVPNVLVELVGRRSDIPLGGTEVAPQRADHFRLFMQVDSMPGIRQFQLRQHAIGRFTWILDADPSTEREQSIRHLLESEIGPVLQCRFEYVQGMPLETTGKNRFFVNEIPDPEALLEKVAPPSR